MNKERKLLSIIGLIRGHTESFDYALKKSSILFNKAKKIKSYSSMKKAFDFLLQKTTYHLTRINHHIEESDIIRIHKSNKELDNQSYEDVFIGGDEVKNGK